MKKTCLFMAALLTAGATLAAGIVPIVGENIVGFVDVAAPASGNTIITVPFEACLENGDPGFLSDLVSTYGLTAHASDPASADQLVVLVDDEGTLKYYYYWNKTVDGWTGIETSMLQPDGSTPDPELPLIPPEASAFEISRGLGFWVKRVAGSGDLVLQGQVPTVDQVTTIRTGLNLVGIGKVEAFTLNDSGIVWTNGLTGAYGGTGNTATSDRILVVNPAGGFTEYFYFVKPDGASEDYDAIDRKWIKKNYQVATEEIPAGRGFWYHRRGATGFVFKPDGE